MIGMVIVPTERRSLTEMRQLVRRKIEDAFPTDPVPAAVDAIEPTHCVEHLHEILGGQAWNDLTPLNYRHCSDGFSLLTVTGLHYYLPGYMIAELTDPDEADVVAKYWTDTLGGYSEFDRERMAALGKLVSIDQVDAIALWIGYYANSNGFDKYVRQSYATLENWANQAVTRSIRRDEI